MLDQGHDVKVLVATDLRYPQTMPCEIPESRVIRTSWLDINGLPKSIAKAVRSAKCNLAVLGRPERSGQSGRPPATASEGRQNTNGFLTKAARLYTDLLNLPDDRTGWLPFALCRARSALADWTPELVYASSPPPTSLLVGRLLARYYGAPWVAELRDRWADDPYYEQPAWRARLDQATERWTLATAAGIVTVSEPWAEFYREKHGKPTAAVLNGFDPKDFDREMPAPPADRSRLRIVYTGGIYPGRRDPRSLFRALKQLKDKEPRVVVEFFGAEDSHVLPLAEACGVRDAVAVRAPVPYLDALAEQRRADVLLLMQWDDPREQGNVPAKLFEYLAARRPILGLGLEDGVPARIISERQAGLVSNDPNIIARQLALWNIIARQLALWLDQKRRNGVLPPLPEAVCAGFSRDEQFARLADFLARVARQAG
jgi:hypothetical protein